MFCENGVLNTHNNNINLELFHREFFPSTFFIRKINWNCIFDLLFLYKAGKSCLPKVSQLPTFSLKSMKIAYIKVIVALQSKYSITGTVAQEWLWYNLFSYYFMKMWVGEKSSVNKIFWLLMKTANQKFIFLVSVVQIKTTQKTMESLSKS